MKEKWVIATKRADFNEIGQQFQIDPVLARIIRNRDVVGQEQIRNYLHGSLDDMHDPWLLFDMESAVQILKTKIAEKKKIRIIGDYDIDGVMATYILEKGLENLGAQVDFMIPHRIRDGYGLNDHLISQAIEDQVDTILTCDNGISAFEQIQMAKDAGLTVIITDHHKLKDQKIPCADAVIDPQREEDQYPFAGISGAVVAWKLIMALYESLGRSKADAMEFLEYAAFATVGDVMDLVDENRIIVKEGLKKLEQTTNQGLRQLMRVTNLLGKPLAAYHIGFILGPCVNASGRLDTAHQILKLLRTEDPEEAGILAEQLLSLNEERKNLTLAGTELAVKQLEEEHMIEDKVYVIYLPDCHESLAGIIAGRIRENYNHPALVLTKGEESVKGSGRSIPGYDMHQALSQCAEYFIHFGGHAMAAGFSLLEADIPKLRQALNDNCQLEDKDFEPKIVIDVPMPISYITKPLIEQLKLLEPCGKGNQKPVFAQKNVQVLEHRIVGKNKNVVSMKVKDESGTVCSAVCYTEAEQLNARINTGEPLSVIYYPEMNSFGGRETIQIVISHFL